MSDIDKVEEPEASEVTETPSPEDAKSPEEFDKLCEAEREKIIDDIKSGKEGDQEKIDDVADKLSPDEIKERRDEFGDVDAAQDKYRDAVFGEHKEWSDEERTEAIANAKEDFGNAAYLREIYDEASERQNADLGEPGEAKSDEAEAAEEVDDLADDEVVTESDPEEPDDNEMTTEREHGISTDDVEINLPSDMESVDLKEPDFSKYKDELGHNDFADLEAAREVKYGERLKEYMDDITTADSIDDGAKALKESKTDLGAINEEADKAREWLVSQGHVADYTDDYDELMRQENEKDTDTKNNNWYEAYMNSRREDR